MLEEAEKRDHRKLGRELDLFHIDEHSPGTVFWHPKGWAVWQEVEQYMRRVYRDNGYQEVGPQILDKGLWEKTGHWDKYRENMFTTESEKRDYALKPMNCPGHIIIFKQGIKSYRDLPLRFGEFGSATATSPRAAARHHARAWLHAGRWPHLLYRRPDPGRGDGFHHAAAEGLCRLRLHRHHLQAVHPSREAHRLRRSWDKAENALAEGCAHRVASSSICRARAPSTARRSSTRSRMRWVAWQCGTIQVDPTCPSAWMPNSWARMASAIVPSCCTAPFGSLERFIGILIEQHAGALPCGWRRCRAVLNITDAQADYAGSCAKLQKALPNQSLRVVTDLRNEKITYKIREHSLQKLPYILVVGDKEKAAGAVAVRARGNKTSE
jgi:threonyl-tRNA synthetase